MSEVTKWRLSWLFVALIGVSAVAIVLGNSPVGASDDHNEARALRSEREIVPLAELLARSELAGLRVLEAELEREGGRLVYELELLDEAGQVHERYYDATTGQPLTGFSED